jgi:hypothetical protein
MLLQPKGPVSLQMPGHFSFLAVRIQGGQRAHLDQIALVDHLSHNDSLAE